MRKLKPIYFYTAVLLILTAVTINFWATNFAVSASPKSAVSLEMATGNQNGQWLPGFHLPGADAGILATANDGSNLYFGGGFTHIGDVPANRVARFDGSNWHALGEGLTNTDGTSVGANSMLWADGNLYVGGFFELAGGIIVNNVARWDGTEWHALGSGTSSSVTSLAWDGTYLYAGGFLRIDGQIVDGVARWDGSSWSETGGGFLNSDVGDLVWVGSNLYVTGNFNTAGGTPVNNIARWDGNSWLPLGSGLSGGSGVTLYYAGSDLYVGGRFNTAGGVIANGIAKWDGNSWSALGGGFSGKGRTVNAITWHQGFLYAGGRFTSAGSQPANNIARWDGTDWQPLGTGTDNTIFNFYSEGSTLYVGGNLQAAGDIAAIGIAKWENDSWSAILEGDGLTGDIRAITGDGINIYAGGSFLTAGGVAANNVARWDGGNWSPLGNGLDIGVLSLLWADGNLYAGGYFGLPDPNPNYIARWDGVNWNSLDDGVSEEVYALAWDGTNLYAGGDFGLASGQVVSHIARWDGVQWHEMAGGVDFPVYAILWADGNLYVAGWFSNAGGIPASRIARWDGTTWHPLGSGLTGGIVYALAWDGQNLYAGGNFSAAGGSPARRVAMWDGTNWSNLGSGLGLDGCCDRVNSLVWSGTNLYAAGFFNETENGTETMNYVSMWDGASWNQLENGLDDTAFSAYWTNNSLYVGGEFNRASDELSYHFAVWKTSPDFTLDVTPPNVVVCPGNEAIYTVNLAALSNFNDNVTLSASGHPPGTTPVFAQNPITPPDSTTLTISDTISAAPGNYAIDIIGTATTRTHTTTVALNILSPAPTTAPTLLTPDNGAANVPNQPTFTWTAAATANQYLLEIATDAAFNTIVYTKTITGTSHTTNIPLNAGTEHHWRVTAQNTCGSSLPSPVFSFTTEFNETKIYLPAVLKE